MLLNYKKFLIVSALVVFLISLFPRLDAALTCSITTAAACTDTIVLRMSSSTNAHAEMWHQSNSNYSNNVICCSVDDNTLSRSCSGTFAKVLNLASTTDAHVQESTVNTYSTSTCLSIPTGSISVAYQSANCSGYDTTLASISDTDNAHVGSSTVYTIKVCGSENGSVAAQYLTYSISTTTIYFGALLPGSAKYASSSINGDTTEVEAHNIQVNTNAASGFSLTVQGQTLTDSTGDHIIDAIGGTNTGSNTGVEQFGLRATVSGGTGAVSAPYAASGFAYAATATTSSEVGNEGTGDNATSTYSIRYIGNISNTTEAGSYSANLVYSITANF